MENGKKHESALPKLASIVRTTFAIPASSAEPERHTVGTFMEISQKLTFHFLNFYCMVKNFKIYIRPYQVQTLVNVFEMLQKYS